MLYGGYGKALFRQLHRTSNKIKVNDMSNQYSFSLVTKQRKDAEKLLVRAEEVLKELDPERGEALF